MIKNKTRGKVLCEKTMVMKSFFNKARGLMFRGKESFPEDSGMLFVFSRPGKYGFWTPFVRFPIDIIFLGPSGRVVDIKENLKPWRMCSPSAEANYALELNSGMAKGVRIGDFLEFSVPEINI